MRSAVVLAGLVAAAAALTITEPELNDQWDFSTSQTVEWQSVDSEPQTFDLYLVNHNTTTTTSPKLIAAGVNAAAGEYIIPSFVAEPGSQYTIEARSNSTNNTGILAQSQVFNVTKSGVASSSTTNTTTTTSGGNTSTSSGSGSSSTTPSKTSNAVGMAVGVAAPLAALFAFFL